MRYLAGILCILMISGCTRVPFQKTSFVPAGGVEPREVLENYRRGIPGHYQMLHTIMFQYGWNRVSALGYAEIDRGTGSFAVAGMNPVGVKLFEISGGKEGVTKHFVLEGLSGKGDFTSAMAQDIRRIYFDLLPVPGAEIMKKGSRILFRQADGGGVLVYTFAGKGWRLVEKEYFRDNTLRWRVSYYEYRQKEGKIYPWGIILHNYQNGYSLTVKVKEIQF